MPVFGAVRSGTHERGGVQADPWTIRKEPAALTYRLKANRSSARSWRRLPMNCEEQEEIDEIQIERQHADEIGPCGLCNPGQVNGRRLAYSGRR